MFNKKLLDFRMAKSIKLFQDMPNYELMAILPSGPNQTRCMFWKQVVFAGLMILYGMASLAFFLFEATRIMEYGDTFYAFSTEVTATVYYLSFVLKIGNILTYIDKFNILFHESKYSILSKSLRFRNKSEYHTHALRIIIKFI